MSQQKVAIVTGANRGIGLEICRQLGRQEDLLVLVTSRDQQKGVMVCEQLRDEGLNVRYHQLDVNDPKSIKTLAQDVENEFGRCDILVNNAGILPDAVVRPGDSFPSVFRADPQTITKAMATNVYGPLLLCQALVPLMKKNKFGRIVNLSSGMGQLADMNGGYPAYRISKASLNALTRILADELQEENILVNTMCPGWVKTDMGGPNATREIADGADTAVWLAMLPDNGPSGRFFRDRQEMPW